MSWLQKLGTITNATKAQIIAAINAVFGLLIAFNVILTQAQIGAVDTAVNALLALVVALTFTQSSMRLKHPRPEPVPAPKPAARKRPAK